MNDSHSSDLDTLIELESRHDELLERLDELDKRIEKVLAEWMTSRETSLSLSAS
jgi:tetrahydromethanopterin S-methyltransferase subunit G